MKKNKKTISLRTIQLNKSLIIEIRDFIVSARSRAGLYVNLELTMMYWRIGNRVRIEILKQKRAEYGAQIVSTLSTQLAFEYGDGFGERNLFRMIKFAECFPNEKIVSTLSAQLTWSHFLEIISIDYHLKRDFYAEMCRIERWSVRVLRQKIGSMLFERTAISKQPIKIIEHEIKTLRETDKLTPDLVFRDPYFLGFLGLKGTFQEKDLENSILREIEEFIMELGIGFTFVERQKRMIVDGEDFYLDLLFYHRNMHRLVAIELKLGKFKPDYKGQMELYLNWLDKHERKPGEERPVGLILCAGKSNERIELLELSKSGIRVAEYMLEFLPKKRLQKKLHEAITRARLLFESSGQGSR